MRAPSTRFGAPRSSTSRLVVTVRLRSAEGSRNVRKTVLVPGRRLICATCPSTHTQPSLLIQEAIFWLTTRTGHGWSAVDAAASGAAKPRSLTWVSLRVRSPRTIGLVTDTPKRVLLAKPRGYCAGVDRAVQTVEEALKLYGPPIYVRKEIVHNRHVVATLRAKGAIFV